MESIQKFFGLYTQKGSPVAHSPYNIILLYVAPFAGPDDTLSPLRWMSTHLHHCRATQGSLADDFNFCLNIYIICSTVGRSIASISDLGEHIYLGPIYWLHITYVCVKI